MGSPNGGIIGVVNPTSFGKCTVTSRTSSTPLTTQPGTRLVSALVVAGGGGGGGSNAGVGSGGGGAGGFRTNCSFSVCGATGYPITVGAGGAGGYQLVVIQDQMVQIQFFQQLHQQEVEVVVMVN
jgi:hypothetical protein